jgi:hypothetical protein
LNLGDSFFTPEEVGRHLWIVVSRPDDQGRIVLVNLSSNPWRNSVQECAVVRGEHPSVGESFVRCDHARLAAREGVSRLLASGHLSTTKPASPAFVERLQRVLGASPLASLEVKSVLRTQGFIQ